METNKIIGYVLIIAGILMIVLPLWQTYNIFTGKSLPAQVFTKPISNKSVQVTGPLDIQSQVQNAMTKVLPLDFINDALNLITWLLLMWILIYGGGKIADIGVKLLKDGK